jgi:hypothetical protein
METEKVKTIEAIREIIEVFEIEILDDYVLEMNGSVMSKPYLKEGIIKVLVVETGSPPAFVTDVVDLIYRIEEFE